MFVEDLRADFYRSLIGKRILVIVNYDIDAICACKILQNLFQQDNMLYSVVPVMGVSGIRRAFNEHRNTVKNVVLVNCGGNLDLVEFLQPAEDIVFYLCDSHRPYDVCNVYSDSQIRILGEVPEEGIPAFESIFRDSDSEAESGGSSDEEEGESRVARLERKALKLREKRQWEKQRDEIMFEYTQHNFYGRSSALLLYELAWKLSKESVDLLWWAIIGATEQLLMGKVGRAVYALESDKMQSHVSRLTNRATDQNVHTAVRIVYENDLNLVLYRHWSVVESLRHSMQAACRLRLWTVRGEKRLHELLVDMGLPLVQARQNFASMDLALRKEFFSMLESQADKYGLGDLIFGSFTLQDGYRNRYSAADCVYATIALLESIGKNRTPEHCFMEALNALARAHNDLLDAGIGRAKTLFDVALKQVQNALDMHQVRSAGPFLYYVLAEENPFFSCPYGLALLAKFVLRAYVAVSRNRRAVNLPLVAAVPLDVQRGLCLMIGVTPIDADTRNLFGRAFEEAAIKSAVTVSHDSAETCIVQIRQADITKFLDALTVVLS